MVYDSKMLFSFLYVALSRASVQHLPRYEYFNIPEEYERADTKSSEVVACFEYIRDVVPSFLDDFRAPPSILLLHAWKHSDGATTMILCEVLRSKLRYLVTIQIPNISNIGEKYITSIQILNRETEGGAHWGIPDEKAVEIAMIWIRSKFGESIEMNNVVLFKTIMKMNTIGQMVIDAIDKSNNTRMLFNLMLLKNFGSSVFSISSIDKIY